MRALRRSRTLRESCARLDYAELVALRIGQHYVRCLRALADVQVRTAELQGFRDGPLLVLEGRTGEIEMHLVRTDLERSGPEEVNLEASVVARQENDAIVRVVDQVPAKNTRPEYPQAERVVCIDTERMQAGGHAADLRTTLTRPLSQRLPAWRATSSLSKHSKQRALASSSRQAGGRRTESAACEIARSHHRYLAGPRPASGGRCCPRTCRLREQRVVPSVLRPRLHADTRDATGQAVLASS